jgi:hypothetical protein
MEGVATGGRGVARRRGAAGRGRRSREVGGGGLGGV